jgi:CspA family cold shock protein
VAASSLQGVVKSYDPISGDGTVLTDTTLTEYELSRDALAGSVFRMLRQGQRIVFDLDDQDLAVQVRVGSEADMGTPGFPQPHEGSEQHPQGGTDA